jgi:hypothetical protein
MDDSKPGGDYAPELTVEFGEHLFIDNDSNGINQQHTGEAEMPSAVRMEWQTLLNNRHGFVRSIGSNHLFVLAPDKQSVFRHLLPTRYKFRPAAFVGEMDFVIDPTSLLQTTSRFVDTYPKNDSHWDHFGAYLAFEQIRPRLSATGSIPNIEWYDQDTVGDLGKRHWPLRRSPSRRAKFADRSKLVYTNYVPNNGGVYVHSRVNTSTKNPTVLVFFGDSFGYALVHFLREVYDIVVHIHLLSVDLDVVRTIRPDFVISELTERFMFRVPSPADGSALKAVWLEKVLRRERLIKDQPPYFDNAMLSQNAQVAEIVRYLAEDFQKFGRYFAGKRTSFSAEYQEIRQLANETLRAGVYSADFSARISRYLEGVDRAQLPG